MYAGVACGCCMGNMVVVLEHTPIPTLSPYFFHQFIPTFYLIFNVLVLFTTKVAPVITAKCLQLWSCRSICGIANMPQSFECATVCVFVQ